MTKNNIPMTKNKANEVIQIYTARKQLRLISKHTKETFQLNKRETNLTIKKKGSSLSHRDHNHKVKAKKNRITSDLMPCFAFSYSY